MQELLRLKEIVRRLREPGGCDWDRAQDFSSMREHLLEEAHELIEAVDRVDHDHMREELGDVLFLVFFYARLAEESGHFALEDVARIVSDKLVRRHPHVFAGREVSGVDEILKNWEQIKAQEKGGQVSTGRMLEEKTALHLPALLRSHKVQSRAAKAGFDWPEVGPVFAKLEEEIDELKAALSENQSRERLEEELGDVLFTVVNIARHLELNAELSLARSVRKFIARFQEVEDQVRESGRDFASHTLAELDSYWNSVRVSSAGSSAGRSLD